jgi:hypothetical protein
MPDLDLSFHYLVNYAGLSASMVFLGLIGVSILFLAFFLCITITQQIELARSANTNDDQEANVSIVDYLHLSRPF